MYAIYQPSHGIYGVGDTLEEAKTDAAQWLDNPDEDLRDLVILTAAARRGETSTFLYARPCTDRLATEVQEHNGDCLYEVNNDGLLDLVDDEHASA